MDKPNVLVSNNFDLIDRTEALELVSEVLLGGGIGQVAYEDISSGLLVRDGALNRRRQTAGLTPSNLEFLAVKSELLDLSVGVERRSGGSIKEGDENAGTLGEEADVLDRTKADEVEEFINGCV